MPHVERLSRNLGDKQPRCPSEWSRGEAGNSARGRGGGLSPPRARGGSRCSPIRHANLRIAGGGALQRMQRELETIANADLLEDVVEVRLHRAFGDREL